MIHNQSSCDFQGLVSFDMIIRAYGSMGHGLGHGYNLEYYVVSDNDLHIDFEFTATWLPRVFAVPTNKGLSDPPYLPRWVLGVGIYIR